MYASALPSPRYEVLHWRTDRSDVASISLFFNFGLASQYWKSHIVVLLCRWIRAPRTRVACSMRLKTCARLVTMLLPATLYRIECPQSVCFIGSAKSRPFQLWVESTAGQRPESSTISRTPSYLHSARQITDAHTR